MRRSAQPAVEFEGLRGVDGKNHSLTSLAGERATVVVFIGNGCPTLRSYEDRLMAMANAWRSAPVELVAINSNNASLSPSDTFAQMASRSTNRAYNFAYLKDADGAVARRYGAVCTPHAFVLDSRHRIVYHGRIDDSRGDRRRGYCCRPASCGWRDGTVWMHHRLVVMEAEQNALTGRA